MLLLFCGAALAETHASEDTDEPDNWYQIEFILFEHLQSDRHILRYEDVQYTAPKSGDYLFLVPKGKAISPFQHELISDQDLELKSAIDRMRASSQVKVFLSGGWQQAIGKDQNLPPVKIATGKQFGDRFELEGSLSVRRERYMHIDIDVFLSSFQTLPYADIKTWFFEDDADRWPFDWLLVPLAYQHPSLSLNGATIIPENVIHLQQTRRIKDGEVHYIDHPALGLIATIKRIDAPFEYGANSDNPTLSSDSSFTP